MRICRYGSDDCFRSFGGKDRVCRLHDIFFLPDCFHLSGGRTLGLGKYWLAENRSRLVRVGIVRPKKQNFPLVILKNISSLSFTAVYYTLKTKFYCTKKRYPKFLKLVCEAQICKSLIKTKNHTTRVFRTGLCSHSKEDTLWLNKYLLTKSTACWNKTQHAHFLDLMCCLHRAKRYQKIMTCNPCVFRSEFGSASAFYCRYRVVLPGFCWFGCSSHAERNGRPGRSNLPWTTDRTFQWRWFGQRDAWAFCHG